MFSSVEAQSLLKFNQAKLRFANSNGARASSMENVSSLDFYNDEQRSQSYD